MEPNDHPTDKYLFDQGIGAIGELIYTIDQRAKYEISVETGFMSTLSYSDNSNSDKYGLFDEYFTKFYHFCFELQPKTMIKDALKFEVI